MALSEKQKRKLMKDLKGESTFTEAEVKRLANDHASRVIRNYIAATMIVLRDEWGFGKQRLERFLSRESDQAQLMAEEYVTADDIFNQIKLETKFDFEAFLQKKSEGKINAE